MNNSNYSKLARTGWVQYVTMLEKLTKSPYPELVEKEPKDERNTKKTRT